MDQSATEAALPPTAEELPLPVRLPAAPKADSFGNLMRSLLQASALFVIGFLFLRTFALEPFGVPTGSMAPALIGNHREAACPRCDHPVVVGDASQHQGERPAVWFADGYCPNCGKRGIDIGSTWEVPGDRLMVDKNVFNLRSPRRWEVAVFRCPVDISKPYVKRIVGLPGESIRILEGEIFANGELARKSLEQVRETRLPIFDMAFAPPGGWGIRWLVEPVADNPRLPPPSATPPAIADANIARDAALILDATNPDKPAIGLTYRHWNIDDKREESVNDTLAYNGAPRRNKGIPVHEFTVECDLEIVAGSGSFACRLGDGLDTVKVEFPIGEVAKPAGVQLSRDGGDPPRQVAGLKIEVGRTYHLEFAFVDRRASVALDGKEILPALDLPADADRLSRRGQVSRPIQLGVRGVQVVVHRLKLYRDIYYRSEGTNAIQAPYLLPATEYFFLGDNSSNSNDSREWSIPGVPERDFIGKPFLIHQPLKIGRTTVNGTARPYQTVDWSRLRWMR